MRKIALFTLTLFLLIMPAASAAEPTVDLRTLATKSTMADPAKGYKVVNPMKDISPNSPYYEIIHYLRDQGIINGYEDGTFRPNQTLSRKHLAALLNRSTHRKGFYTFLKDYTDVPKTHPNYQDIRYLRDNGIFSYEKIAKFHPNQVVTRGETAYALFLLFELYTDQAKYDFKDISDRTMYATHMRTLAGLGIATGDNGYYNPEKPLTRAHFAVFMYRAMNTKLPSEILNERAPADFLKYEKPEDVPKPKGYSAQFLKNQQRTAYQASREHQLWNGVGTLFGVGNHKYSAPLESLEIKGLRFEIPYEEMVKIISGLMKTGEVYIGEQVIMYYNFEDGRVHYHM